MFYLTKETLPVFIPLGFIGVYRWFFFAIRFIAFCLYVPKKPSQRPKYKPHKDATIVIPTIDSVPGIYIALKSLLANNPYEILFVTIPSAEAEINKMVQSVEPGTKRVRVITVAKGNKRNQMVAGINHCKTEILVFCDDDVIWGPKMLEWILAPFEDRQMGGVGTSQTVMPVNKRWTVWEVLAGFRITMRNIEIVATTYIDGGVCCLSGRTGAYRTRILRDPDFQWKFTHEFWLKKYHQHSGDDKFLTRWMHSHAWKTFIQCSPEAELQSYFKDDWTFLKQLLRWTRNTWRSDIRSLIFERFLWTRHPFTAFTMFDKFFNMLTLIAGPFTVLRLILTNGGLPTWVILVSFVVWLIVTRTLKYLPYLVKRPWDFIYLPIWILFGYYFALMKIYCLCTLHVTEWGTRKGADHKDGPPADDLDIYTPHWKDDIKSPLWIEPNSQQLRNRADSTETTEHSINVNHSVKQLNPFSDDTDREYDDYASEAPRASTDNLIYHEKNMHINTSITNKPSNDKRSPQYYQPISNYDPPSFNSQPPKESNDLNNLLIPMQLMGSSTRQTEVSSVKPTHSNNTNLLTRND